jgi:predicted  nucleic acid-binding Zn-ribbon protein
VQAVLDTANARIVELHAAMDDVGKQLASALDECDGLRETVSATELALGKMTQLKEALAKEIPPLKKELQETKDARAAMEAEKDAKIAELENEVARWKDKLEKAKVCIHTHAPCCQSVAHNVSSAARLI